MLSISYKPSNKVYLRKILYINEILVFHSLCKPIIVTRERAIIQFYHLKQTTFCFLLCLSKTGTIRLFLVSRRDTGTLPKKPGQILENRDIWSAYSSVIIMHLNGLHSPGPVSSDNVPHSSTDLTK